MVEFFIDLFLVLFFSCYTQSIFLSNTGVLLSTPMIAISTLNMIVRLICENILNELPNVSLIFEILDWGRKWFINFNACKTQLFLFDYLNNYGAIDLMMNMPVLHNESTFNVLSFEVLHSLHC